AALMSTADSVLLSVSSMLTKDIYHRQINPNASDSRLTTIGKMTSWVVVAIMAGLAIYLNSLENKPTLVKLMDMKFDMLMQLAPGFILGAYWRGMKSDAPFWGLVCGLVTIFALYRFGTLVNWGVHAGIFGLAVNLLVVWAISVLGPRKA
ncbi:MAG: sodium:solute symporter family transporter, partial [Limisphaerales bacterium]